MGEHRVYDASDERRTQAFVRGMLEDIHALELLIERDLIERDTRRIGVEQEMYLIDRHGYPAPVAEPLVRHLDDPRFSTEFARFNLEANLPPRLIGKGFLRAMETELHETLDQAQSAARALNADVLLTGILPTLRPADVQLGNLTGEPRYKCLNDACMAARGGAFTLTIDGIERFESSHDCVVIEGANTSLQLHLQVNPADAARLYNLAQLISAPLLAAAANAPVLLGRRVWCETRVALFERAFEYRSVPQLTRGVPSRVGFGEAWVQDSILEVFRDNAMRYHVIMVTERDEQPLACIEAGGVPELAALCLHNGTVWRWNRPCYGITDGKPHLRIENRALPAGPTVIDQVANAALFYGLMQQLDDEYGEVSQRLAFDNAKTNFLSAAQHGLDAELVWLDGRRVGARALLLDDLIPAARAGLSTLQLRGEEIDRYLDVMQARCESGRTGARWLLDLLDTADAGNRDAICRDAVATMRKQQQADDPVHRWDTAAANPGATGTGADTVGEIMSTDLFTVRPDDVIDLATSVMQWKHVRHIPVESASGELVGLLSTRELLQLPAQDLQNPVAVATIMQHDPPTVSPDMPLQTAIDQMLHNDSGCLLVVARGQLAGIVTERDLLRVTAARLRGR